MARKAINPTLARIAKEVGLSYEVAEKVAREFIIEEEAKRQLEADAAERRRLGGRRPEWLRDFWIMHEVEWHRGQMSLKAALNKVSKVHELSFDIVRKVYKKEKFPTKRLAPNAVERHWRNFFRRHRRALQTDLDRRALQTDLDRRALQKNRDWRKYPSALVREFYRRERCALTDRDLREHYRRHPGALLRFMESLLERARAEGLESEAEELRSRIEDLRQQDPNVANWLDDQAGGNSK